MKVNGTDEIIKLLLETKAGEVSIKRPTGADNHGKLFLQNEEMSRKDEFIMSDKGINVKTEVQFTKNLYESPEAYLHRISTEVISLRDNEVVNLDDSVHHNKFNSKEIMETATRSGLLKEFVLSKNENSNRQIEDIRKWLLSVIIVFLLVLAIRFFYRQ